MSPTKQARLGMTALVFAYLRHHPLRTLFNVLLFAIGTALMATVVSVGSQLENGLSRNLQGVDMVIGAKGSPLQLVLSSVLHADMPTGNISLKDVDALRADPLVQRMVRQTIPVALGDNAGGYRIVGTTPDYVALYHGQLQSGRMFGEAPMEAVLGSEVAGKLGLAVGARFAGSHGLAAGGELHDFAPYTVVGTLTPTGTIVDQLVLTPVSSVWYVHEHDDDEPAASRLTPEHREVTALLVRFRTPLAVVGLPRYVNQHTNLQAASPAMEAFRLRQLLGVGSDTLKALGGVLVTLAALGLWVSMAEAVRQRLYDLALMRCFGAGPLRVVSVVVLEGLCISALGGALGLAAAALAARLAAGQVFGGQLSGGGGLESGSALMLFGGVMVLGLLGSLLPALRVYRLRIPTLLAGR